MANTSFDPDLPRDHSPISASEIRGQLVALENELIDVRDTSAVNPSGVGLLSLTVSNPPTQTEMQTVVDKLNELIAALQR